MSCILSIQTFTARQNNRKFTAILSFLDSESIPKLSAVMQQLCEGKLSMAECYNVLSTFQNNKTPGNGGLAIEFYRTFWTVQGQMLVKSINYCYTHGELSSSKR